MTHSKNTHFVSHFRRSVKQQWLSINFYFLFWGLFLRIERKNEKRIWKITKKCCSEFLSFGYSAIFWNIQGKGETDSNFVAPIFFVIDPKKFDGKVEIDINVNAETNVIIMNAHQAMFSNWWFQLDLWLVEGALKWLDNRHHFENTVVVGNKKCKSWRYCWVLITRLRKPIAYNHISK